MSLAQLNMADIVCDRKQLLYATTTIYLGKYMHSDVAIKVVKLDKWNVVTIKKLLRKIMYVMR